MTRRPRFHQVWFAGTHSDVGGGYEENGLSNVALKWMVQESPAHGLLLDANTDSPEIVGDPKGVLHNPLWPFWWVLTWWSRRAPDGGLIHESIRARSAACPKSERQCARLIGRNVTENKTLTDEEIAELKKSWA